ncbi:hypothetical protein ACIG87_22710 [Micromonospora sp. NPDC051925]|uniref:hypothetical protein n=1 Tax=Micromonospora sp. NPDC051925 TaxID=3364288 RepID=UPI0037CB4408
MPSPVVSEKRSLQLLAVLFWTGVAFAPIAALILMVADGNGPLRFAAVLAITSVVLIGLSIALRADDGARSSGEEVLDELEQLRRELRSEIVAAAQRGNQALDQSQRAEEQVTALRRQLDAAAAGIAAGISPPTADERAGGAGRVQVPAAEPEPEVPVGRRRAVAEETASGWGRRADTPEPVAAGRGRATADRPAAEPTGRRYAPERPVTGQAGGYGASPREPRGAVPAAEPASRPLGVVRHTETVHVTTRHTVVDGPDPAGGGYGGGYAGRWTPGSDESSWAGGEPERPWSGRAESTDRGWSAQPDDRSRGSRPAPRDERAWPATAPAWGAPADERGEPARPERSPVVEEADAWTGSRTGWTDAREEPPAREVRAGGRWAEVRDDGRARELRVGERRAEAHADGAGYRYSDQWASVRQEDPYRDDPERVGEQWGGGRSAPDDRPALPAGGVPVPQQWREPARGQRPAEEWPARAAQPVKSAQERPARAAQSVQSAQERPARAEQQPGPDWSAPAGQPAQDWSARAPQSAQDWPAQADGQRWGGQPAEQRRDREPVVSWRTPEPEPRGSHQWGDEQRYGYPPQDDAPRAGGHWR